MTHDELREAVACIVAQGKCKYMPEWTAEEWEGWRKIADRIRALIDGGGLPVKQLLAIRDALIQKDVDEAYHVLYSLADPTFIEREPWAKWEAARTPPQKDRK